MSLSIIKNRFAVVIAVVSATLILNSCDIKCLTQVPPQCSYNNPYATDLRSKDHFMDSVTARSWIARYIANKDSICHNTVGVHDDILPDSSESFNRDIIKELLCLKDCIGIRIYLGMDDAYKVHFLLSGIDPCGNTLYLYRNSKTSTMRVTGASEKGMGEMGLKP